MTNFEVIIKNNPQFVKEVLSHHVLEPDLERAIDDSHKRYAWYNGKHTTDKEGIKFLQAEYIQPVLDNVERKYLSDIIRPFRHNVMNIRKSRCSGKYFIEVNMKEACDRVCLPYFSRDSKMYTGMKERKAYTLKELGL